MSLFDYGLKNLRVERREKRGALVVLIDKCSKIKLLLTDDRTRLHLENALHNLELVVDSVNTLEVLINDLVTSTSDWFGSRAKAKYMEDLHGVIAGLNIVIKDPENHNLIAVDHSGLEAVIGLNRKQRVIAMKPFFDLLVGVCHIIQKHSFAAIQGVTKGAFANESLKENIESELEDLEKELQCKITFI